MKHLSFVRFSPALTAISKRFGFDAHYFAKNSIVVTTAYGISVIKGIITGYLVTRMFPTQMYGEYRFVLSVVGTVGFIGLPELPVALASALARKDPVSLPRIAGWLSLVLACAALVLLGCIPLLHLWGRSELWPLFLIVALLFVPSNLSTSLFSGIVMGTGAFSTSFRTSLLSSVLVTISVLAMLLIHPSSLLLLAFTIGIPAIVYLSVLVPYTKKYNSKTSEKTLLMSAVGLSFATIPMTISWYMDGLLISAFFGLNQLAIFSVSILIPEQVKTWMKELFPILFAKQARGNQSRSYRKKLNVIVLIGMGIFAVGTSIYVLLAPIFIPLLFPAYPVSEVLPLTSIAAFSLIAIPPSLYAQSLEALGMVKAVSWINWSASAVFVVALILLVPIYGPLGAIIARGIFRFSYAITAFLLFQRLPIKEA